MIDAAPGARNIVVLAPNWLGDVVMATPLLSRLAAARDRTGRRPRVILAVRRSWAELFVGDVRLAGVIEIARPGRHGGLAGIARLARELRAVAADAVVVGPPSLRAGLVARLAGIPVRVGYRGDGRAPLLSNHLPRPPRGDMHHSRELLALGDAVLAACGLAADPGREGAWGLLPAWGRRRARTPGDGPPVWVFAPGSSYGDAKVWPQANASAFVRSVVRDQGRRLALVGDAAAARPARELVAAADVGRRRELAGPAAVVDLTGRTTVGELAALLLAAEAFVGNDSGVMHLAGALGVPTVGLFGSTNPAWTAPLGPTTMVLAAAGFPCRPCYRRSCNQELFCLETIGADEVLAAVAQVTARQKEAT